MKKQFIPIAVIAVVILAGVALWLGLRGGGALPGGEAGKEGVTVFAPEDTEIIVVPLDEEGQPVDTEAEKHSVSSSGRYTLDLPNGAYSIIANRGDKYNPWSKNLILSKGFKTELYPMLFPQKPELEAVTEGSEDHSKVTQAFSTPATVPTAENPRKNEEGTAELYMDENIIYIRWVGDLEDMPEFLCPGENVEECRLVPIFQFSSSVVENIEFFGEHEEVLVLDQGASIIALEIDRRLTHNRQPLFEGPNAAFRVVDGDLYVSSDGVVSKVILD